MKNEVERACTVALAAPLFLAAAAIVWVSVGETVGAGPWAGLIPRNSAEAAGLGRASEMLRFLHSGEDPHAVHDVRPEVISSAILKATTLEAAMWSRELAMIQLLDREGAIRDTDREALGCLAADLRVDDVAAYLAPGGVRCPHGEALAQVAARTGGSGS